jgi:hypothetical protein
MLRFFRQPYPVSDKSSSKWQTALGTGLFIAVFLYLFRPFGLSSIPTSNALTVIFGYGIVTFLCLVFNLFLVQAVFPKLFDEEKWTVGHQFFYTLWIVLTIGIGNALYTITIFQQPFTLLTFLYFQIITVTVAVVPVSFMLLLNQNRLLRRNQKLALKLSGRIRRYKKMEAVDRQPVQLTGENTGDILTVPARDILFINAADNYVEVTYFLDNEIRKKLLRTTLKTMRTQLKDFTSFYRCHRSWIVNLDHVVSVNGNAQGYRLKLGNSDVLIPVSRSLNSELDSRLAK